MLWLAKTFVQPPGAAPKSAPSLNLDKSILHKFIASNNLYSARDTNS